CFITPSVPFAERQNIMMNRLKAKPKDFTFDEAETLLKYLGYTCLDKGKTSGSRIIFMSKDRSPIMMHKPHPGKELKVYQVKQLIEKLEEEGLI
ncbi:MAG: type II toxin-antitoxin system HicA family toxin, partial [Lachnospiraceae bacterium]|nr:type II toxin-antitoxin system HicA family toxin [Lachnospiraceae bacterium]